MVGWMVNGWVGAGCLDQSFLPRTGPASTSKTGWSCRRPPPSEPPPWQETEESPLSFFHSGAASHTHHDLELQGGASLQTLQCFHPLRSGRREPAAPTGSAGSSGG